MKQVLLEKVFQQAVVELAVIHGWRVYHVFDSKKVTGKGFPDLVLARKGASGRPGECIFRELKTERGRVSRDQKEWIGILVSAGIDAKVWRPKDWLEIEERLSRPMPKKHAENC